jgi:Prion-inhibition and propagation
MEAVGLAVGLAGLASLFGTCSQILEHVSSFRNFEHDSRVLFSRFEVEKLAFKQWGERVGFIDGRVQEPYHRNLDDIHCRRIVQNSLISIQDIVNNTQAASQKYERTPNFETLQSRDLVAVQSEITDRPEPMRGASWRTKAIWTAKDKRKLTRPVELLGALVEKLYQLVPPEESKALDQLKSFISGKCSNLHAFFTYADGE